MATRVPVENIDYSMANPVQCLDGQSPDHIDRGMERDDAITHRAGATPPASDDARALAFCTKGDTNETVCQRSLPASPDAEDFMEERSSASTCASSYAGSEEVEASQRYQPDGDHEEERNQFSLLPGEGVLADDVVPALARVFTAMAHQTNFSRQRTCFHHASVPSISVHDYMMRISTHFRCSTECFVLSLVYIDRIAKLHPQFGLCMLSIHRVLLASLVIAAKFQDDRFFPNSHYARVGGVSLEALNVLEVEFLELIGWEAFVSRLEYDLYLNQVLLAIGGAAPNRGNMISAEPELTSPERTDYWESEPHG
mmetsp:Transcript_7326/g.16019  ORF Transcript_7326/g.16019 Transcript_7326/m.16019 type:complete len:312 (+) Transcript_7326:58-993(+)|eukprot:CAMPEP_0170620890 /NCGR_PEP_ID=MMETSP0224-20130122/28307_1 /TAXON_ID=285029 /ORGANISM="Togula jolla, Strain CCCM 725" /LENGTH=311 /DNA_ID=CAMNT_0010947109 /DNA_START=51 /DNA_END=986 /DNA_ORIENTATION=-